MISNLNIVNPKLHLDPEDIARRRLFPYYAGYSKAFVESVLSSLDLPKGANVFDPWNGSGTTTTTSFDYGLTAIGSDLNPVMSLVAKATFVSRLDLESLVPLAHSLVFKIDDPETSEKDPLHNWFHKSTASYIREIEERINKYFISHNSYTYIDSPEAMEKVTPLAAFFYLALFRVIRRKAYKFFASNPTWIRRAKSNDDKELISRELISNHFIEEVKQLCKNSTQFPLFGENDQKRINILLANAEEIPFKNESIDAVITSPPYCTRIDYAVATHIELAILRIGGDKFIDLRRSLTGSSTVKKIFIENNPSWGNECGRFLQSVYNHPSKASKTYYYKSHLEYFDSLYKSLSEVSRVLSKNSPCVLVVQNSHYKEINNDIAEITIQMSKNIGMSLAQRVDFPVSKSMATVNLRSKNYLRKRSTTESVLFLTKE